MHATNAEIATFEAPLSAAITAGELGATVKALTFDVFGTVVDYRGSIVALGEQINARDGADVDWAELADAWRGAYRPSMDAAMQPGADWVAVDDIYATALVELEDRFGLQRLSGRSRRELDHIWHQLTPWGDSVPGLRRLQQRFLLATLSNGNVRMLADMARFAELPWDVVLSAELCGVYKPDPRYYQMALELLRLQPHEVMMVAAHQYDLDAARRMGFRTAFVMRPLEHGPEVSVDLDHGGRFDLVANDMIDLARQLGT